MSINKQNRWTEEEITVLNEHFSIRGALYCAEIINRTIESVRIKATRLGLRRDKITKHNIKDVPNGYYYCSACKQILDESFFYETNSIGAYKESKHQICRGCNKEKARRSYRNNKSSTVERYKKNPDKKMYQNIKAKAKLKNIPFNLDEEDIKIPTLCPVLGIPLIPFSNSDNSPTVDKYIPQLGYIKENINIISRKANLIKTNATKEDIKKLFDWMVEQEKELNN